MTLLFAPRSFARRYFSSNSSNPIKLQIVYGSQSVSLVFYFNLFVLLSYYFLWKGTSESLSYEFESAAKDKNIDCSVIDARNFAVKDLKVPNTVTLFVLSCYGKGEPTGIRNNS